MERVLDEIAYLESNYNGDLYPYKKVDGLEDPYQDQLNVTYEAEYTEGDLRKIIVNTLSNGSFSIEDVVVLDKDKMVVEVIPTKKQYRITHEDDRININKEYWAMDYGKNEFNPKDWYKIDPWKLTESPILKNALQKNVSLFFNNNGFYKFLLSDDKKFISDRELGKTFSGFFKQLYEALKNTSAWDRYHLKSYGGIDTLRFSGKIMEAIRHLGDDGLKIYKSIFNQFNEGEVNSWVSLFRLMEKLNDRKVAKIKIYLLLHHYFYISQTLHLVMGENKMGDVVQQDVWIESNIKNGSEIPLKDLGKGVYAFSGSRSNNSGLDEGGIIYELNDHHKIKFKEKAEV